MKIGFIGCGNMAGAILNGCLQKGFLQPEQVMVCEIDEDRLSYITSIYGVSGADNIYEILDFSDTVILGVKPQTLPVILADIKLKVSQKEIVFVSIAAGQSMSRIETMLGTKAPIIRVMPNLNVRIGEGVSAICVNSAVNENSKQYILDMFQSVGIVLEIPEEQFPVFTAIAGCSPAFTYMYVDALARAAVRLGMHKKQAVEIAAAAVAGSARNLSLSEKHPWDLIDQVCSPGGTTIEGITALQAGKFEAVVSNAVTACVEKDKSLA